MSRGTRKHWLLGQVVTPENLIPQGAVCVEGEILTYVGPSQEAPRDPRDPVTSTSGWITPGLIDLHIHGAGGFDLMAGTREAIVAVSETLAQHGTTSYLATSVAQRGPGANRHLKVTAELASERLEGAQVLGIHLEGPYVNPARGGLIRNDRIWPVDQEDLKGLLAASKGNLRMMTLAPELPGVLDLLPILVDHQAVSSLGHTEASFEEARVGFSRGIRHVTHLYNAMRGFHHREPGALGAVLADSGATTQIIADGVHVHPQVLSWTAKVLSPEALVLITDALPAAGLPDGTYAYDDRPYESKQGTAWHHADSGDQLFGTTLLLDEMVRRAMKFMGLSFPQAIAAATLHPARTLGLEKRIGQLATGRQADFVIWDESLQVTETVIRGTTVFHRWCLAPNVENLRGAAPTRWIFGEGPLAL